MYMDNNDTLTPRDRIGDEMLRRMLGEDASPSRPMPDLPPEEHARESRHGAPDAPCETWGLRDHPLGMVYAPWQDFSDLYDRDTALRQGTIFRKLDLPFRGESVRRGGAHRG